MVGNHGLCIPRQACFYSHFTKVMTTIFPIRIPKDQFLKVWLIRINWLQMYSANWSFYLCIQVVLQQNFRFFETDNRVVRVVSDLVLISQNCSQIWVVRELLSKLWVFTKSTTVYQACLIVQHSIFYLSSALTFMGACRLS